MMEGLKTDPPITLDLEQVANSLKLGDREVYAAILQDLPIAIYTCDAQGRILFYNQTAVSLWGRAPEIGKELWCGSWQIYNTDGAFIPHDACPMAVALTEARPIRDMEIVVKRPDGTLHNILPHATPLFNNDGQLTGAFNVLLDTTKSKIIALEKELTARINVIFNGEGDLKECMLSVLQEICLLTDKSVAEAWISDADNTELKLFANFTSGKELRYPDGLAETLGKSGSLPGKAFEKRSSVFIDDLQHSKDYVRRNFAQANNLVSALAVPIVLKNEVISVLIFYDESIKSNKITFTELGENILAQLAVNIQRKKTEEELNHFFTFSNDILCHLGRDGFFTKVNPAFCKALGYTEDELLNKPYSALIHPEDSLSTQLAEGKFVKGNPAILHENRFISKLGEVKWFSWMTTPLLSGARVFVVAKDITDKRTAELQLAAYSNRISTLLESITDGFCALDKDWAVTYWNMEAERILSMPRDKVIGKNIWELYKEAIPLKFYTEYHRAMNDRIAVHFQDYFPPLKLWVEVSAYPSEIGLSIYFKDITDRINTFERLEKSESEIRQFAKQLNKVLEDERSRIAHEIHDELGQQLSGIKMSLSSFKKLVLGNKLLEGMVGTMVEDIDRTVQSLRTIATELRLGILDTLGLIASLEWLAKEFENKTKIECHLDIDVNDLFYEHMLSTCFFRICQEALTNITKHASATEVAIEVRQDKNGLELKITDNGIGIDDEKLENPFSIGLLGMRQRAKLVGATLAITSQPGSGTCILLKASKEIHETNSHSG